MMLAYPQTKKGEKIALQLAQLAVDALLEEVRLTPKPGLVDRRGNGCHHDLSLELMEISALSLYNTFYEMAVFASGRLPSQQVREQLGVIGRKGELAMLSATNGVNTHKGAIWALGLITGAAAILISNSCTEITCDKILFTAGAIAQFPDRFVPVLKTNGGKVRERYLVRSAKEEAMEGFPLIREIALTAWGKYDHEDDALQRLNVLLSLMADVDDTCILNRKDMQILAKIQLRARRILDNGGLGIAANWKLYTELENEVKLHWVSQGGSADLLAATIFINKIIENIKNE